MATIVNARDVQLQAATTRLLGVQIGDNVQVPPTNVPGLEDAMNVRSVALSSTSQVVQMMNDGTQNPSSITVVAIIRGLTNTPSFGIVPGSGTMSVTPVLVNGSFTFNGSQMTTPSVTLRLSITQDGITYSDDMTFVKVEEGADGIAAILTNENVTLQADSAGNISSYVGASGNFKVYQGTADVTSVCTFAILSNPDSIGASINASGVNAGVYSVNSGIGQSLNQTSVTFRATFGTLTIDKTFSISKAKAGLGGTGLNNAIVYIYQRSGSAPTLPSANVTYTFATGGMTGLNNGWSATIPSGSDPLYVAAATASSASATDVIASNEWASPVILAQNGIDGTQGGYTASIYIYQRATSTPAVPSADCTYTFTTQVLSGLTNGWTTTIPIGTNPIFVSTATAFSLTTTDTITSSEWAVPSVLAQNGTNGSNGPRGSQNFLVAIAGTTWSDALATTTASVGGGPITFDTVQQYNNSSSPQFTMTKYWNGSAWLTVDARVNGNLLVDGSVGAKSLVVNNGSGNNLWCDPNYQQQSIWTVGPVGVLPVLTVISTGISSGFSGRSTPGVTGASAYTNQRVPVTVGKQYKISMKVRRDATAGGTVSLRIDPNALPTGSPVLNNTTLGLEGGYPGTSWNEISAVWTATAPYVGLVVILNNNSNAGYEEFQDLRVEEMMDSALIVQGGITADRINTNNLTVRDGSGNVILGSGTPLAIGYAAPGTKNSAISQGLNLIPNSDYNANCNASAGIQNGATIDVSLRYASTLWTTTYVLLGGTTRNLAAHQNGVLPGGDTVAAYDMYPTGGWNQQNAIPVVPGTRYCMSAYMQAHRCYVGVEMQFFDVNDSWISTVSSGPNTTPHYYGDPNADKLSSYFRISCIGTAPANAVTVRVLCRKFNTFSNSTPESWWWVAAPQMEVVGADATGPGPYLPGPPGNTRQMGFSGDLNATNGATFGVNINGQITPGNVSTYISSAAIGVAQIGAISAGVITTAVNGGASAGRVVMGGNRIEVYDDSNRLRVRIGAL